MNYVGDEMKFLQIYIYIYIYIFIYLMTFLFYVMLRNSERRRENRFLMQFWGYQRIRCVFAIGLFTDFNKLTDCLSE